MNVFQTPVLKAIPAFLVAVVGVLLAWLAFRLALWIPVLLVLMAILVGTLQLQRGRHRLPDDPVAAVRLMEWFVLVPATVVSVMSAVLIGFGVFLEPVEGASVETKKLLAASAAAVGGFVAAAFVKSADDADEQWVGEVVKAEFTKAYETRFKPGSPGANALTSNVWRGISGWGKEARRRRAEIIKQALVAVTDGSP